MMSDGMGPSENKGNKLTEAEKHVTKAPRLIALYDTKTLTPDKIAEHLFAKMRGEK
jgi:hypothetical protein